MSCCKTVYVPPCECNTKIELKLYVKTDCSKYLIDTKVMNQLPALGSIFTLDRVQYKLNNLFYICSSNCIDNYEAELVTFCSPCTTCVEKPVQQIPVPMEKQWGCGPDYSCEHNVKQVIPPQRCL